MISVYTREKTVKKKHHSGRIFFFLQIQDALEIILHNFPLYTEQIYSKKIFVSFFKESVLHTA